MAEISLKNPHESTAIKEENEDWHDTEADFYDHIRSELWNFYEQRRISRDVKTIDTITTGNNVVDIGSGTGNLVLKFAQLGYNVDAVDISENMLDVLRSKVDAKMEKQVSYHHSEANSFLNNNTLNPDVICFSSVLHHLPDYFETLTKAISQLKSGGIVYIVHEPLPDKLQRKNTWLKYLDHLLTPRSSFKKWKAPEKESDLVDYHIDELSGINLEKLHNFFGNQNLQVVEHNKYCIWKSGILTGIDEVFDLNEKSDFKIIARKPEK